MQKPAPPPLHSVSRPERAEDYAHLPDRKLLEVFINKTLIVLQRHDAAVTALEQARELVTEQSAIIAEMRASAKALEEHADRAFIAAGAAQGTLQRFEQLFEEKKKPRRFPSDPPTPTPLPKTPDEARRRLVSLVSVSDDDDTQVRDLKSMILPLVHAAETKRAVREWWTGTIKTLAIVAGLVVTLAAVAGIGWAVFKFAVSAVGH